MNMKPLIKWVGGKKRVINKIIDLLPKIYYNYYELFFGGGSLYCNLDLTNHTSIINDRNESLMNLYTVIKNNPQELIQQLINIETKYNSSNEIEQKNMYLEYRCQYNNYLNSNIHDIKEAVLFIFLNKIGFNGLYRINSKGLFNVAFGYSKHKNIFDENNLLEWSNKLQKTLIFSTDYHNIINSVSKNDLVFLDPPYYDKFSAYNKDAFNESDHIELFKVYEYLTKLGAHCMLTNSSDKFILNLYKKYNINYLNSTSLINSKSKNKKINEIIITNY